MNQRWISISEVSKLLNISRPTATQRLSAGKIPGLRDHLGIRRVARAVFERWLDAHQHLPGSDREDLVKSV